MPARCSRPAHNSLAIKHMKETRFTHEMRTSNYRTAALFKKCRRMGEDLKFEESKRKEQHLKLFATGL